MPDPTLSNLYQRAVLWTAQLNSVGGGKVDKFGGVVVDDAIEISVRWEWKRTNMLNQKRETITVDATIRVAQEVPVDSLIWLGSLNDLAGTGGPELQSPEGVCQVKAYNYVPDVRNRFVSRVIGVVRYKGPLPAGVG